MVTHVSNTDTKPTWMIRVDPARLLPLAWPVYFELIAAVIAGIIDVIWVARLGPAAIGAVTVATTLENLMLGVALVTAGGGTVVLSRAIAARDHARVRGVLRACFLLSALLTVVVCLALFFARRAVADLLVGDAAGQTLKLAIEFLTVSVPGLAVLFAQQVLDAGFKAAGNTRTPMRMAILANAVLIVLDPVLIFGLLGAPALGVAGAALATVIARCVAFGVTFLLFMRSPLRAQAARAAGGAQSGFVRLAWDILRRGASMSADFFARMLAALLVVGVIARFGADSLAAYGAVTKVLLFLTMAAYAVRQAAMLVAARASGSADMALQEDVRRSALRLGIGWALLSGIAVVAVTGPIVGLLTRSAHVQAAAGELIPWLAVYVAFLLLAVVLGGVFFGRGKGGLLVAVTLMGIGLQAVLAPALAATVLGLAGVWLAMIANSAAQACVALIIFTRGAMRRFAGQGQGA
jgi:putative MATE family efflux protein